MSGHDRNESPKPEQSDQSSDAMQISLKDPPKSVANCDCDLEKIHYQAEVDAFSQRLKSDADSVAADEAANRTNVEKFHETILEVAKGAIDRSRQGADAVRTAAAAAGVLYTGVLGVAFSADHPLPMRGLISAVFLGLAIVFSTAFSARLPKTVQESSTTEWPEDTGVIAADFEARTDAFITWSRDASIQGRNLLMAAVVALGLGIGFLPAAFISVGGKAAVVEAQPPFPSPPVVEPSEPSGQVELAKILYQAQVSEVAGLRQSEQQAQITESSGGSAAIFALAAVGLVVTLVIGMGSSSSKPEW